MNCASPAANRVDLLPATKPAILALADGTVFHGRAIGAMGETVGEVVKEGQEVYVKLLGFDDRGKVRLSMKIVDQATGKEIPRAEGEPEERRASASSSAKRSINWCAFRS